MRYRWVEALVGCRFWVRVSLFRHDFSLRDGWSSGGGVAVEFEQVVEASLGVVHVGEQALGAGPAFAAVVVQQDSLADAFQVLEEFAYG